MHVAGYVIQSLISCMLLIFIHIEITCLNLKAPLYGKVIVKGNTPLSKALYSCNHGYRLHGLKERQCQNNGIWYGNAPTCKSKYNCTFLLNYTFDAHRKGVCCCILYTHTSFSLKVILTFSACSRLCDRV